MSADDKDKILLPGEMMGCHKIVSFRHLETEEPYLKEIRQIRCKVKDEDTEVAYVEQIYICKNKCIYLGYLQLVHCLMFLKEKYNFLLQNMPIHFLASSQVRR